mmetsp:Transcript_12310/g.26826  ORF Transcript_12310/g.26826 Transcript_12310/m.26826 type:complete len:553 (+) Transcript_12310:893-2551(+)
MGRRGRGRGGGGRRGTAAALVVDAAIYASSGDGVSSERLGGGGGARGGHRKRAVVGTFSDEWKRRRRQFRWAVGTEGDFRRRRRRRRMGRGNGGRLRLGRLWRNFGSCGDQRRCRGGGRRRLGCRRSGSVDHRCRQPQQYQQRQYQQRQWHANHHVQNPNPIPRRPRSRRRRRLLLRPHPQTRHTRRLPPLPHEGLQRMGQGHANRRIGSRHLRPLLLLRLLLLLRRQTTLPPLPHEGPRPGLREGRRPRQMDTPSPRNGKLRGSRRGARIPRRRRPSGSTIPPPFQQKIVLVSPTVHLHLGRFGPRRPGEETISPRQTNATTPHLERERRTSRRSRSGSRLPSPRRRRRFRIRQIRRGQHTIRHSLHDVHADAGPEILPHRRQSLGTGGESHRHHHRREGGGGETHGVGSGPAFRRRGSTRGGGCAGERGTARERQQTAEGVGGGRGDGPGRRRGVPAQIRYGDASPGVSSAGDAGGYVRVAIRVYLGGGIGSRGRSGRGGGSPRVVDAHTGLDRIGGRGGVGIGIRHQFSRVLRGEEGSGQVPGGAQCSL